LVGAGFALVVTVVVVVAFAAAFAFACDAAVAVDAAVDGCAVAGIAAAGVAPVLETVEVLETGVTEAVANTEVGAGAAATAATVFACIAGEAFTAPAGGVTLALLGVAVGAAAGAAAARRAAAARARLASVGGAPGMGWAADASTLAAGFGRLLSGRKPSVPFAVRTFT
jgi:hypothetical protein